MSAEKNHTPPDLFAMGAAIAAAFAVGIPLAILTHPLAVLVPVVPVAGICAVLIIGHTVHVARQATLRAVHGVYSFVRIIATAVGAVVEFRRDMRGAWQRATQLVREWWRQFVTPTTSTPRDKEQARLNGVAQALGDKGWPGRVSVTDVRETAAGMEVDYAMLGRAGQRGHAEILASNPAIRRAIETVYPGARRVDITAHTPTSGRISVIVRDPFDKLAPRGVRSPIHRGNGAPHIHPLHSCTERYELGIDNTGEPVTLPISPGQHVFIAGKSGSGKSVTTGDHLVPWLLTSTDCRVWILDLEGIDRIGDFAPWRPWLAGYCATESTADVLRFLAHVETHVKAKAALLPDDIEQVQKIPISAELPCDVLIIDGVGMDWFDKNCWTRYAVMLRRLRKAAFVGLAINQDMKRDGLPPDGKKALSMSPLRIWLGESTEDWELPGIFGHDINLIAAREHLTRLGAGIIRRRNELGRTTDSYYLGWLPHPPDETARRLTAVVAKRPAFAPPVPQDRRDTPDGTDTPEGVSRPPITTPYHDTVRGATIRARGGSITVTPPHRDTPRDPLAAIADTLEAGPLTQTDLRERFEWSPATAARRFRDMRADARFVAQVLADSRIEWRLSTLQEDAA